jgi:transglutaminase-like putative cysteine protease
MLYDVRLELSYKYEAPVHGGRHLVRIAPVTVPGVQRVVASSLTVEPSPERQTSFIDFFGNSATAFQFTDPHEKLVVRLAARVLVDETEPPVDLSPMRHALAEELARHWSVQHDSPHHFIAPSPRVQSEMAITQYAAAVTEGSESVLAAAHALCLAIHRDFQYDPKATDVETKPGEAFILRKGVCQDFAHIMIAGLRGMGIPAAYVSGFLRTNPPAGKPRLEGADAMHAWVRVWCGQLTGWVEFDPTNAVLAGSDHISIGHGRDYSDISPIVGVLKTSGSHKAAQSVDVIRVD